MQRLRIERIGETNKMNNGLMAKIIAYRNNKDIDVEFENGEVATHKLYTNFLDGGIKCPMVVKIKGDYAEVTNVNTAPHFTFLVDIEDLEIAQKWFWCNNDGYANRDSGKRLHRIIVNASEDEFVDHINHDKRDNRKSNLRICSNAENCANRGKNKNNTSGLKGVNYNPNSQKWKARIGVGNKRISLGEYHTKEEAAKAYNEAAIKYHGKFAVLNKT